MASGIRFDSLLHSLKELQNEKQCLELKLNEQRAHAQSLEKTVEQSHAKLLQVKETYQKMLEMQKVAVQKMTQTQDQIDCQQELNQEFNDKIKEINSQIQQEKDRALDNIQIFENKMAALAETMNLARKFYEAEALEQKINEIQEKRQQNEAIVKSYSQEENHLVRTMQNLQLEQGKHTHENEIPKETCFLLWSLLNSEDKAVDTYLEELGKQQQEIYTKLQQSQDGQMARNTQE